MQTTWILVAGMAGARVFVYAPGKEDSWFLAHSFDHPSGRLRDQEMVSDRRGRSFHRGDRISHAGGRSGDPVRQEELVFAKRLACFLERARRRLAYARLFIVSSPQFTGILKRKMDPRTLKTVTGFLHQDLSSRSERETLDAMSSRIFPAPPLSGRDGSR
jgi:protein required for attachment to host cells